MARPPASTWGPVAALTLLLFANATPSTQAGNATKAFLVTAFGLTRGDIDRVERGQVVARTVDARNDREIATVGAVRLGITPDRYVEQLADIVAFKRDEAVLQIGTFGDPPDLQDVKALTLDDADVRSLRRCRVGDCDVQLPASAIARFGEVDWRGKDATQRANLLMRQILVEYVADYRRIGAAAMEYADRPEPMNVGREFASMAESSVGGWNHFAALRRHLVDYPAAAAPGTTDMLYWSKEKVGRRTVASITHLAISRSVGDSPAAYAIGSKQIYGTHYFDASLGLTVLVAAPEATEPPVTYLVYVNRSRIDVLDGVLGGVARRIVSSRARGTVATHLTRLQQRLESASGV